MELGNVYECFGKNLLFLLSSACQRRKISPFDGFREKKSVTSGNASRRETRHTHVKYLPFLVDDIRIHTHEPVKIQAPVPQNNPPRSYPQPHPVSKVHSL